MKIAVIGCTHAGTAAITNMAEMYPEADIHVFEKNDNISFLSCGIALYVGGVVNDPDGLFYASPKGMEELGVHMHLEHEVLETDTENKTLLAKNLQTNQETVYGFDKLVITTGSWPITPPIPGRELDNIMLCKNFNHAKHIIKQARDAENITVVGAGYIGIELVEAFEEAGKKVTLIDGETRILNKYLDPEFTAPVQKSLEDRGVNMVLGETVREFKGEEGTVQRVVTTNGEYETDMVVMCIGFRPNTDLFRGEVDMLDNGAIIVDNYMQTSRKDVFAAGDCCTVPYNPTGGNAYIPLATNAVRMGTLVAHNLERPVLAHPGTQGTSGLKIYEHQMASTGLTEMAAKQAGFDTGTAVVEDDYRPAFMPDNAVIKLKIVYDTKTHRLLGAQVISEADFTQSINTLSVAIQQQMTVEQLAMNDFFFQPHFNKPWNYLNMAGLEAMKNIKARAADKRKVPAAV
ncbi:FAD-dependent oxidoreductase [Sinobaca sp. H24]|uniref:FAD-dependent oxidoreductase n=1 Tax=Sinobaca sp. H24 TaxID=2923376 RepID=UPI00207AE338|nr:FAD-dependent oxidoreductase [Sinobaca sp. H24]